jgi:cell division protein FtsW (lipid II flippase)
MGRRSGSPGQWNNYDGFGDQFLQCSVVEQMNTIKAFWIFVLPTELMFAAFLGLAICLAFAARAKDSHEYVMIERIMVGVGILTILFAITLFFAPVYKYGVVLVVASLVSILTAAARVRWLNGLCILVLVVTIFYMFDFVHGNFLLNFSSGRRLPDGIVDNQTSGVLHATRKMFSSVRDVQDRQYCTRYYKYFLFDPQIRDSDRFDNPEVTTFGYCSRAWVVALYLFEAAAMNLMIVQFFLALLSLAIRFHKSHHRDPMQAEVVYMK